MFALKLLLLLTVQCAYHLGYQSMEEQSQEMETPEEEEQQETGADMPTVLAEFSSVVADTQQYIVADQLPEGETQVASFGVFFFCQALESSCKSLKLNSSSFFFESEM